MIFCPYTGILVRMLLKLLLKKPILVMGIIMMFVFLSLYGRKFMDKVGLSSLGEGFETSSCRGVLAVLKRTLPDSQKARCRGNHLLVSGAYPIHGKGPVLSREILCPLLYREMANSLKFLSDDRTTPPDVLERVGTVRFKLIHPQLTVYAMMSGKSLAGMSRFSSADRLAEYIRASVTVQELPPTCY